MGGHFEVGGGWGNEVGGDLSVDGDESRLQAALLDGLANHIAYDVQRRHSLSLLSRRRAHLVSEL